MFVSTKRKSSPEQRSLSLSLSTYRPPSFWQAHAAVAVEAAPLLAPAPALPLAPKERERERETERAIEKESSRARGRVGSIETKEKKGIFFSTAAPLLRPPRKKRPVSPTSFSSLSLSLSLSLSHSTYNDGERLWSHGLRWAVSPKRKEAWSSVRASKKNDAAGNSFGGQKKALNQRSLFLPSRSLQNRCFPMWADFSEVRSCLHVDFGERDKRERAFGSLSFSFRRPLFVGDGLFPCSQSSTPSLNLFSTSTFLSPPPKKTPKNSASAIPTTRASARPSATTTSSASTTGRRSRGSTPSTGSRRRRTRLLQQLAETRAGRRQQTRSIK